VVAMLSCYIRDLSRSGLSSRPILDGLRQVVRLDRVGALQVGDGARQLGAAQCGERRARSYRVAAWLLALSRDDPVPGRQDWGRTEASRPARPSARPSSRWRNLRASTSWCLAGGSNRTTMPWCVHDGRAGCLPHWVGWPARPACSLAIHPRHGSRCPPWPASRAWPRG